MTAIKILHVVRGMLNSSGTTHIVKPLAEEQARQGANVSVWLCEQRGNGPVLPDDKLVTSRVFATSLPLYHPGISLPFARAMRKAISGFDYVHIHAVWNFPTFWTMRMAARAGVPFMVAPQGSLEPWAMNHHGGRKALYARYAELPLMNRATALQALSPAEAAQMRAQGLTAPVEIIPNGVDLEWFNRAPLELSDRFGVPAGRRTVLSLSRLDPKKGIDVLIRGFAGFAASSQDVQLVIAGQDHGSSYRSRLEALAHGCGVADRVTFIGEVRGSEKFQLLRSVDGFALISHSEGLPVALVEAMAAGLPVIATPGCNVPEIATAEAGLIVETEPEQVFRALQQLFGNPDMRVAMAANARKLVEARFTWQQIAAQTLSIYRREARAAA